MVELGAPPAPSDGSGGLDGGAPELPGGAPALTGDAAQKETKPASMVLLSEEQSDTAVRTEEQSDAASKEEQSDAASKEEQSDTASKLKLSKEQSDTASKLSEEQSETGRSTPEQSAPAAWSMVEQSAPAAWSMVELARLLRMDASSASSDALAEQKANSHSMRVVGGKLNVTGNSGLKSTEELSDTGNSGRKSTVELAEGNSGRKSTVELAQSEGNSGRTSTAELRDRGNSGRKSTVELAEGNSGKKSTVELRDTGNSGLKSTVELAQSEGNSGKKSTVQQHEQKAPEMPEVELDMPGGKGMPDGDAAKQIAQAQLAHKAIESESKAKAKMKAGMLKAMLKMIPAMLFGGNVPAFFWQNLAKMQTAQQGAFKKLAETASSNDIPGIGDVSSLVASMLERKQMPAPKGPAKNRPEPERDGEEPGAGIGRSRSGTSYTGLVHLDQQHFGRNLDHQQHGIPELDPTATGERGGAGGAKEEILARDSNPNFVELSDTASMVELGAQRAIRRAEIEKAVRAGASREHGAGKRGQLGSMPVGRRAWPVGVDAGDGGTYGQLGGERGQLASTLAMEEHMASMLEQAQIPLRLPKGPAKHRAERAQPNIGPSQTVDGEERGGRSGTGRSYVGGGGHRGGRDS